MSRIKIENRIMVKRRFVTSAYRKIGIKSQQQLAEMITELGYPISAEGINNWYYYGWPPDAFKMLLKITGSKPKDFEV